MFVICWLWVVGLLLVLLLLLLLVVIALAAVVSAFGGFSGEFLLLALGL